MAQIFHYKARDKDGDLLEGAIEAETRDIVVDRLKGKGYFVTSIEAEEESSDLGEQLKQLKKVKLQDLALFCRQFATMINSGLSLVRSLDILVEQTDHPKLKDAIMSVQENVESGMSLSKALEQEKKVFPQLFISMVEAGEAGGILDDVLLEMADHFENENDMKQKVISALAYPVVISLVAIGVVVFLVTVILPTFVDIFAGMDQQLPLPTRLLLGFSNLFSSYWYVVVGLVAVIAFGIYRYYQTDKGRRKIDWILLKTPLFGDLITKISIVRFSRTLGVLIQSGVSILDGLEVVSKVVSNSIISDKIRESRKSISSGDSIVSPLRQSKVFPQMVLQMIRIGEETGSLDEMLAKIAQFYDQEVEHKVESMVSLIEPALILVLGVVVGSIVVSMMLPMFNMMSGF
ncbi:MULTISPECIES: type II secretion system F family protein [unclassified Candidatus Frackibacter]|uniref:type II secretion system F family protein n=1 Tax=unclassified Candidatus Frackibacter TaxID=2648818 RepID=UPI00088CBAA8|nr:MULTISPECIES: type II secretion system F family protein [unclassified Candidatus Frackibacter]SDC03627.1 type II secretion system protein F (GspF) [Candidatus Frackibacter sp. WG11]SEM68806.1 type II secretion system protein F (GspF) [Candidatus Frackibacter sp. WG12]SFL80107.1 type II secretion system protein F (GspF) [Candidatus Frackibacter sp. WG13]